MNKKTAKKQKSVPSTTWGKIWHFIWYEDSVASWLVNIVLAFVIIKFLFYPSVGFFLNTSLPVVAVVSGSMEHRSAEMCSDVNADRSCNRYVQAICGQVVPANGGYTLDQFWQLCGSWYEEKNITKAAFNDFSYTSGFNRGDVMVIYGKKTVSVGDVIVFTSGDGIPIIHRVVAVSNVSGVVTYQTKGDHNSDSISFGLRSELAISPDAYIGTAVFKIPWIGYLKLWVSDFITWVISFFR
jgi:signal peptidase I